MKRDRGPRLVQNRGKGYLRMRAIMRMSADADTEVATKAAAKSVSDCAVQAPDMYWPRIRDIDDHDIGDGLAD